jgi:hypothetical protein
MAALPYGIPMIFGGALCGALALALEKVKPLMILFGFAGFVFITTGVCMVLFWMFGGSLLGIYFTLGSADVLADLALVKLFGVTSAAIATTISALAQ